MHQSRGHVRLSETSNLAGIPFVISNNVRPTFKSRYLHLIDNYRDVGLHVYIKSSDKTYTISSIENILIDDWHLHISPLRTNTQTTYTQWWSLLAPNYPICCQRWYSVSVMSEWRHMEHWLVFKIKWEKHAHTHGCMHTCTYARMHICTDI
jgi:hypothetical protein